MSQKHQIVYLNEHLTKHQTYIDIGRMGFESPFLGTILLVFSTAALYFIGLRSLNPINCLFIYFESISKFSGHPSSQVHHALSLFEHLDRQP